MNCLFPWASLKRPFIPFYVVTEQAKYLEGDCITRDEPAIPVFDRIRTADSALVYFFYYLSWFAFIEPSLSSQA